MNRALRYLYPENPEQESLLRRVTELEERITELEERITELEERITRLRVTNRDLNDTITALEAYESELRNMVNVQRTEIDTIKSKLREEKSQIGTILFLIPVLVIFVSINIYVLFACKESQGKVLMLESQLEQAVNSINATCTNSSLENRTKIKEYFFQLESLKYSVVSENKYFEDLSKTLQGIEWRHKWLDSQESREGPTFYLGLHKVRVFLKFQFSGEWEDYTANYYLKRLEGPYDDVIGPCHIKYRYYAYVDEDNEENSVEWRSEFNTTLEVGKSFYISSVSKSRIARFLKNNKLVFRVYFDTSWKNN